MSNPLDDFLGQAETAYNDGMSRTDTLFAEIEARLKEMETIRVKLNRIAPIIGKELRPETALRTIAVGTAAVAPVALTPAKTGIPGARAPRSAQAPRPARPLREPTVGKLRTAENDKDQGFGDDE